MAYPTSDPRAEIEMLDATIQPHFRRRLIHRFPYGLIYRIDPDEIIILATMHPHRHPDYWIDR
jgi:hypothetical protein